MPALASISLAGLLDLANLLLSSTVAILAFSLLAYVLAYNVRNRVGRAFAILLACVMIVYTGDVLLYLVSPAQTNGWAFRSSPRLTLTCQMPCYAPQIWCRSAAPAWYY